MEGTVGKETRRTQTQDQKGPRKREDRRREGKGERKPGERRGPPAEKREKIENEQEKEMVV